jgi:hypothetical protein
MNWIDARDILPLHDEQIIIRIDDQEVELATFDSPTQTFIWRSLAGMSSWKVNDSSGVLVWSSIVKPQVDQKEFSID